MTEQELIEKIAERLYTYEHHAPGIKYMWADFRGMPKPPEFLKKATQILALVEEAGYVKKEW